MKVKPPEWGGTVVCIASGPSLTAEDCQLVRASGYPVVVTNTTFRAAPWADVLIGHDLKWWLKYLDEVNKVFAGRRISQSQVAPRHGIESTFGQPWFRSFANSGCSAISLGISGGAKKIVLLAFDCCVGPEKQKHWHPDHQGLSNCLSMPNWPAQFAKVAAYARSKGVRVVNCSRRTALKCFELGDLETELQ